MDKVKVKEELEVAVRNTCEKFINFQGVYIFGSFVQKKKKANDLDLIPVLKEYDDSWNFMPLSEGEPWYSDEYYKYQEIETFLVSHFTLPKEYESMLKTSLERNALIHIERIMALDVPHMLVDYMNFYKLKPEHFIGNPEAAKVLKHIYDTEIMLKK